MPAPRKPTNVLELHGAFKENPAREAARANEPKVVALLDIRNMPCPPSLTPLEALTWAEVARTMHARVVADTDLVMLIAYVRLATRVLYDEELDLKVANAIRFYSALFGLSPADRSRVQQLPDDKPAADPMDEFKRA